MIQQSHFWIYTQRTESRDWNTYLYTHIHSSIIYSSEKAEAKMSINRWMDKQIWNNEYSALKSKEILKHASEWMRTLC